MTPPATPMGTLLGTALDAGPSNLDAATTNQLIAWLGLASATATNTAAPALSLQLSRTREFGLILLAGSGGLDGRLDNAHFKRDRATVCAVTELTDGGRFLERFRLTIAYQRLVLHADTAASASIDHELTKLFSRVLELAAADTPLQQLNLDCTFADGRLCVTSASGSVARPAPAPHPRPLPRIDKLLHPKTMGVIGVSATSMNFGRIILHNIVGSGYPREQLCVIRPGESEIDGVRCVDNLAALDVPLDLLVVAVPSDAVYALVDEIIGSGKVHAAMLIPGGLGETAKSREPAGALAARINAAHAQGDGGPIFLGANCLGVVSHPGRYDSWFIPLERLPKPQKKQNRNSVMLSQSGAFMITRISQNPWLDPRYMVASGNQTDLTHGDLLSYFADAPGIDAIGLYIEGFKDGDGRHFARAVRRATVNGKIVVIYKSGRTPPGAAGVMGHTASLAGDPVVFDSVLRQAGAVVTDDFNDFDDIFYLAGMLHDKHIGPRLGAISGAGFEAVGMADASQDDSFSMEMAVLAPETVAHTQAILERKKLNALVEVRNPIDINPGADDEAHLAIVEAFADDPQVDAIVVGLDPAAPSMRALEASTLRPGFDIHDAKSSVNTLPPLVQKIAKPVIAIVDGGRHYDAMADGLMDRGVCVFRNCARGTRALRRYVEARLAAAALRER